VLPAVRSTVAHVEPAVAVVRALWLAPATLPLPVALVPARPTLSDTLAWTTVVAFLVGAALVTVDRERAGRRITATAWVVFGGFWLSVFPTFAFEMHSVVEGVGSLVAVPLCLHAAVLTARETPVTPELLTLSRAVALMGLLYLPVETVPVVRETLIEVIAVQSHALMTAVGYEPVVTAGPEYGYRNRFVFPVGDTHYSTYIVTACTGIGSIAIFGGLVAAVRAPLRRRVAAAAGAVAVIWLLNVLRNAFISVAYGHQWFRVDPLVVVTAALTGESAGYASFFVADRILGQGLAVLALVAITVGVLHVVPELVSTMEGALYVATRREVDLGETLGIDDVRAVADGGRTIDADPDSAGSDGETPADGRSDGGRR
jgi:archaeosortase A (PGF-CTERM-specific)